PLAAAGRRLLVALAERTLHADPLLPGAQAHRLSAVLVVREQGVDDVEGGVRLVDRFAPQRVTAADVDRVVARFEFPPRRGRGRVVGGPGRAVVHRQDVVGAIATPVL